MNKRTLKLARVIAKSLNKKNIHSWAIYSWRQLQKNGGIGKLDDFIERIIQERALINHQLPVKIISAKELGNSDKKALIEKLENKTGKKIVAKFTVQDKLIGGIIIKIKDEIIDLSWRGKLDKLKSNLTL